MSFPKLVYMAKNTPFFPILHVFAPLNDVRAYTALSWKTTLITWIFLRGWYSTSNTGGPPGVPPGYSILRSSSTVVYTRVVAGWVRTVSVSAMALKLRRDSLFKPDTSDHEYYYLTYQTFLKKTNRHEVVIKWIEDNFDSTVVQKLSNIGQTLDVLGVGSGDGE